MRGNGGQMDPNEVLIFGTKMDGKVILPQFTVKDGKRYIPKAVRSSYVFRKVKKEQENQEQKED